MVKAYVKLVKEGLRTLESVPASLREAVKKELEAENGTAE